MHFRTIVAVLAAAAHRAAADSEKFGLLTIRAGSPLQHAQVYWQDGYLHLGRSNCSLSAVVTDCGFLRFNNGAYAVVGHGGHIRLGPKDEATDTFAVKNGHLTLFNQDGFEATPKGKAYLLSTRESDESFGVFIRAQSPSKGYTVANFVAANNCSTEHTTDAGNNAPAPAPAPAAAAAADLESWAVAITKPVRRRICAAVALAVVAAV